MKLKFSDIEDAFMFVGSGQYGMHSAYLCPATGRIYYLSEMAGIDEAEDEGVDVDECLFIPHKNGAGSWTQAGFQVCHETGAWRV